MRIINLTQHVGTPEQQVDEPLHKSMVRELLTFDEPPSSEEIMRRCRELLKFTTGYDYAMVGGASYFVTELCALLNAVGITPLHSFTKRVSEEVVDADGTVRKTQVFKHICWIES